MGEFMDILVKIILLLNFAYAVWKYFRGDDEKTKTTSSEERKEVADTEVIDSSDSATNLIEQNSEKETVTDQNEAGATNQSLRSIANRFSPASNIRTVASHSTYKYESDVKEDYVPSEVFDIAPALYDCVVVDTETTGLDVWDDKVIQLSALKYVGGEVVDSYNQLIRPDNLEVPNKVTKMTGLTTEMLKDKPVFEEIEPDFREFVGDLPWVGHNIKKFDCPILLNQGLKIDRIRVIDTYELANTRLKNKGKVLNCKLQTLKKYYALPFGAHDGLEDCKTTLEVYKRLVTKQLEKAPQTYELVNLKFCITGVFNGMTNRDIKEIIEQNGGTCTVAITSTTNYVVKGQRTQTGEPTRIEEQAKQRRIKIIDFETLENYLVENAGKIREGQLDVIINERISKYEKNTKERVARVKEAVHDYPTILDAKSALQDCVVVSTEAYDLNGLVQVAAIKFENGKVTETYNQLVKPDVEYDSIDGLRIKGITYKTLNDQPSFDEIKNDFSAFVADFPWVGYGIKGWDIPVLINKGLKMNRIEVIDTLPLAYEKMFEELTDFDLEILRSYFGLPYGKQNALEKCKTILEIYKRFATNHLEKFQPTDELSGLRFCAMGMSYGLSPRRVEKIVEQHGGIFTKSVSGRTDYLVKGYVTEDRLINGRPARAEREAIKNGTKIISFDDLEDMILHGKSM